MMFRNCGFGSNLLRADSCENNFVLLLFSWIEPKWAQCNYVLKVAGFLFFWGGAASASKVSLNGERQAHCGFKNVFF